VIAPQFEEILSRLAEAEVKFIVIGGVAGNLHGSARVTYDLDLVYSRDRQNIRAIADLLKPFSPYLRGAPPGLPFSFDETTIRNGLNFTLTTTLGELDLLGEVVGGGSYEELLPFTQVVDEHELRFRCLTLERLIQIKRAAGRPKDLEAIAELQAILEERRRTGNA
jgi:predicted nucleotidyltransferase